MVKQLLVLSEGIVWINECQKMNEVFYKDCSLEIVGFFSIPQYIDVAHSLQFKMICQQ